jgi:ketosteroid isomerase-like protein
VSREDVELVRRLYEAWLAGDQETALAGIDPDIEWVEPEENPDAGNWRGPEGVRESFEKWTEPFENYRLEVREFVDLDPCVLAVCRQHARGRGSGVEVDSDIWHLWTLRDGRAVRAEMFLRREDALRAAESEAASRPEPPA